MQTKDRLSRHAALVDHMADALGLDLDDKMMQGALTPEELSDAVLRCTLCSSPDQCETWVDSHARPQPDTPDYCRNAQLFRDLRGAGRS